VPSIVPVLDVIAGALAPIPCAYGQENVGQHGSPPSVVFVPRGDRFAAVDYKNNVNRTHPSRATRLVGLEVRIWAKRASDVGSHPDWVAAELLVDKVVLALLDNLGSNLALEDGEWADTSGMQEGLLYLLRVRVAMPVIPAEADATHTTTTWLHVIAPANTQEGAGPTPASITTTVDLASDEVASPAP